jgi:hypothetical protein
MRSDEDVKKTAGDRFSGLAADTSDTSDTSTWKLVTRYDKYPNLHRDYVVMMQKDPG